MATSPRELGRAGNTLIGILRSSALVIGSFLISFTALFVLIGRHQRFPTLIFLGWVLLPTVAFVICWRRDEVHELIRSIAKGAWGEVTVGRALRPLVEEGFVVLHDLEIPGRGNTDHVVIGPTGVYAIETKARSGPVSVVDERLLIRGYPQNFIEQQAVPNAKCLTRVLRGADLCVEVMPVVAMARRAGIGRRIVGRAMVVDATEIAAYIRSCDARLNERNVTVASDALAKLVRPAKWFS